MYLNDKRKKAVALSYNQKKDIAPKIVASGYNDIAEAIIQKAKENNIHIYKDRDLVKFLSVLQINSYVPKELYEIIAKIFTYIYSKDKELSQKNKQNT